MDFAAPYLLWLLAAAPAIALCSVLLWRRQLARTAAWSARGLWDRVLPGHRPRRLTTSTLALALAVAGLAVALARPRWGSVQQTVERTGVEIVFVLDTSLSMATKDVVPSRLWVAQSLVRRLIERLPHARMALVEAEGEGVVMAPLTVDSAVIELLLDTVAAGSLPTPGTELTPALVRAIKLFPEGSEGHRVMIVLSDGEDHGPDLERALRAARAGEVVIHAIGIGTPEGLPLELPAEPGRPVAYKRDEGGNVVVSRLEERTLERLCRNTGGQYLRAASAAIDVGPIATSIERIGGHTLGEETISTREERFQLPAALTILALIGFLAGPSFARQRPEAAP